MRIVHFSKYEGKGGAARAALNSVRAQRAAGADALLCVGAGTRREPFVIAPRGLRRFRSLANFAIERIPFRLIGRSRYDARSLGLAGMDAPFLAESLGADLVVLHNIDGFVRIEDLPRLPCPVVWRTHDMWAMCGTEHYVEDSEPFRHGSLGSVRQMLSRWTFRRKAEAYAKTASLTICAPSNWLRDEIAASHLLNGREAVTIPNGIDTRAFSPEPRAEARARLGLPAEAPLLLFGAAGGLDDPRKGFDLLAAAIGGAAVALTAMGTELVAVGGGDIGTLPLPAHLLGHVSDPARLRDAYAAADLVVAPSRLENLSLMVLEALACGTPVIAFDVGGMPDMIQPEVNGLLVAPYDVEALARALTDGLAASRSDPEMRVRCRSSVEGRFDLETEASGMLDLFERIVANTSRHSGGTT